MHFLFVYFALAYQPIFPATMNIPTWIFVPDEQQPRPPSKSSRRDDPPHFQPHVRLVNMKEDDSDRVAWSFNPLRRWSSHTLGSWSHEPKPVCSTPPSMPQRSPEIQKTTVAPKESMPKKNVMKLQHRHSEGSVLPPKIPVRYQGWVG